MKRPVVDINKCNACGSCIVVCPRLNIKLKEGKAYIGKLDCIKCHACIDICSEKAIVVK